MTPDQREPNEVQQETGEKPSFGTTLLNEQAIIIDNVVALKFSRRRQNYLNGKYNYRQRLKIVSPSDQEVDIESGSYNRHIFADGVEDGFKINRFYMNNGMTVLRIGSYDVFAELIPTSVGKGLLLRVESPRPMGHAIVDGIHTEDIKAGLSMIKRLEKIPPPSSQS